MPTASKFGFSSAWQRCRRSYPAADSLRPGAEIGRIYHEILTFPRSDRALPSEIALSPGETTRHYVDGLVAGSVSSKGRIYRVVAVPRGRNILLAAGQLFELRPVCDRAAYRCRAKALLKAGHGPLLKISNGRTGSSPRYQFHIVRSALDELPYSVSAWSSRFRSPGGNLRCSFAATGFARPHSMIRVKVYVSSHVRGFVRFRVEDDTFANAALRRSLPVSSRYSSVGAISGKVPFSVTVPVFKSRLHSERHLIDPCVPVIEECNRRWLRRWLIV